MPIAADGTAVGLRHRSACNGRSSTYLAFKVLYMMKDLPLNEGMKALLFLLLILGSEVTFAKDCRGVRPFFPQGQMRAAVSVSRLYWNQGVPSEEAVCRGFVQVSSYDVRGREEDAFDCLQPKEAEIVVCNTQIDGAPAKVQVVPATWIRNWTPSSVREYRFHAYIQKVKEPGFYYDVFARSLSFQIMPQSTVVEGALKTGPANAQDGYFVRVSFEN